MYIVHRSELTHGKTKRVSPMLKVLNECVDPRKYFDPVRFLEALQLDSLLPRKEVDTSHHIMDASLYVINRAKLEQMYPYLPQQQKDAVADMIYLILNWRFTEEEARAMRSNCEQLPQHTCHSLQYTSVCCVAYKHPP